MRILHILSQYVGETGSGIYLQSLVREGRKKNHIQGVVSGVNDDQISYKEFDYHYSIRFNSQELPFPIVGMSDIMPYDSTRFSDLSKSEIDSLKQAYNEAIRNSIEDFKPDIILSNHLWLITSMVKEVAKDIKVIGICHGTDLRQLELAAHLKKDIIRGISKLDRIFSLSKEQAYEIEDKYGYSRGKIDVIGGGYNDDIFYLKEMPFKKKKEYEEIKLVYCGKLSYAKGVVELIESVVELRKKYNIELDLIGSGTGEEYSYIKDLVEEKGSFIRLRGRLDQEKLGELLREKDIFVMPSYYEGLSLITIEALASGLLIVSNDLSSLKSYLGNGINNSGLIEYVDSPRMETVDKPYEFEKSFYVERLIKGIELQIKRLYLKENLEKDYIDRIKAMSWSSIYKMIEDNFKNF